MDIEKLKRNLEQKKAKRKSLYKKDPYSGEEESDSAIDILLQAELNGLDSEIEHLERKINRYED